MEAATAFQSSETDDVPGSEEAVYLSDKFTRHVVAHADGGVRATHFSSIVTENVTYPRVGGTLRIPHLNWVFRAFWGRFYQPPPLVTLTGPCSFELCSTSDCHFFALHGERDEEHQFGVTIPIRGWSLDIDNFETRGSEFPRSQQHRRIRHLHSRHRGGIADSRHGADDSLPAPLESRPGASRLFQPDRAGARRIHRRLDRRLADQGRDGNALDHDQRNTLNVGFNATLPRQAFAAINVYYGSGFHNGSQGHSGVSVITIPIFPVTHRSIFRSERNFGEKYTVSVTALNVANRHLLIDNSLTFGGFHYNDPREIYVEFR